MLLCLLAGVFTVPARANGKDSIRVEELLQAAGRLPADSCRTLFYARRLAGTPYVGGTLDEGKEETLVVHLDKADCTTFVETVLALTVTEKEGKKDFGSFKEALRRVRYRDGRIEGYASRLHYFSDWIKDNEQKGLVKERTPELSSMRQVLHLNFMSAHPSAYPRLKDNPGARAEIALQERAWQGVSVCYFPKGRLDEPPGKSGIRNGDILAITTNISGLDVVHTGFACWIGDRLHLLHASSQAKKVVLDSRSLYEYSGNKKTHTGVRVISVL